HKLVNVKQPENPGDAVNLQYLASASTKWTSALHAAVDKVNDNMIKKDDSETILNFVKPALKNMIKKDDAETVINIVKPEFDSLMRTSSEFENMIKKEDSESVLKIVKPEMINIIKKKSLNLTATKRYIDIGNRKLVKTADTIDKYDVVNKGQLDDALTNHGHYSFLQFILVIIKEQ
ncbi:hypothetical protein BDFB_014468, partial [Asbolus verrucosus]